MIIQRDGKRARLFARNGHDWSDRFPLISEAALRNRNSSFVIDGEAVVPDVEREISIPAAPPSVVAAHRRANCSEYCERTLGRVLRPITLIWNATDSAATFAANQRQKSCAALAMFRMGLVLITSCPKVWAPTIPTICAVVVNVVTWKKASSTLWQIFSYALPTNVSAAVLLLALRRRPTFSELVPLWRELVICDGKRVERLWEKDGFERLVLLLSKESPSGS
jgi:hypothetical protein